MAVSRRRCSWQDDPSNWTWKVEEQTPEPDEQGFKLEFDSTYTAALVIPLLSVRREHVVNLVLPSFAAAVVSCMVQLALLIRFQQDVVGEYPDGTCPFDKEASQFDATSYVLRFVCLYTLCAAVFGGECRQTANMFRWLRAFGWVSLGDSWWNDYLDLKSRDSTLRPKLCKALGLAKDSQLQEAVNQINKYLGLVSQATPATSGWPDWMGLAKGGPPQGSGNFQEIAEQQEREHEVLKTDFVQSLADMVRANLGDAGLVLETSRSAIDAAERCVPVTKMSLPYMVYAASVLFTRNLIALFVLYTASGHIAHAPKPETLVTNTVAVLFILDIDNYCFQLLVPLAVKQLLEGLPPLCPVEHSPVVTEIWIGLRFGTWTHLALTICATLLLQFGHCKKTFNVLQTSDDAYRFYPVFLFGVALWFFGIILFFVWINRMWLLGQLGIRPWRQVAASEQAKTDVSEATEVSEPQAEGASIVELLNDLRELKRRVEVLEQERAETQRSATKPAATKGVATKVCLVHAAAPADPVEKCLDFDGFVAGWHLLAADVSHNNASQFRLPLDEMSEIRAEIPERHLQLWHELAS